MPAAIAIAADSRAAASCFDCILFRQRDYSHRALVQQGSAGRRWTFPHDSSSNLLSPRSGKAYKRLIVAFTKPRLFSRNRMPPVSIALNILWILLGGAWMAVAWVVAAIIMAITIIGIPWARAAFNIALYTLLPFGQTAVRRDSVTGRSDLGTGPLGLIGNLIWLVLAGWWLALGHLLTAIVLAVTIIGIPFAWAHVKLAGIALWPIGKVIVPA
jgi:uncharacterized membrane protein YccF (DUF307 family)